MYNSSEFIEEFYRRAKGSARQITEDFEIIFVNDGSPDNSLEVAVSLFKHDKRVKIIDLSRNFGHHKAMMTGLAEANGELVFLIDSDLEEAPELLPDFLREMEAQGADVIYGVQQKRKGGLLERISGEVYYSLFNWFADYEIPRNVVTARLMTHTYVQNLVRHQERELNLLGLWILTGFKQKPFAVQKASKGTSVYNLNRKIAVFVNAITSFSDKPLVFIFYLGWVIFISSSLLAVYLVVQRLFFVSYLDGWVSIIVSIWLLGGLTLICLGIIGIYLSKIYIESKQRPYTIIRNFYDWEKDRKHEFHLYNDESRTVLQPENRATRSHS